VRRTIRTGEMIPAWSGFDLAVAATEAKTA